jgi:hypothetical protein
MRALQVNFSRTAGAPRWVAPLLLAVALVFSGDAVLAFLSVKMNIRKSEEALAKLDPRSLKPARKVAPEELALARETVQRLVTPWDELFDALEQAADDKVALLSIEPDPRAGTVLISGDSKDYLAALSYVLNLSRAEALSQVQLARHEVKGDAQKTVGFSVSAAWRTR